MKGKCFLQLLHVQWSCWKQYGQESLRRPFCSGSASHPELFEYSSKTVKKDANEGCMVVPNFINVEEEKSLLNEIEPKWGKSSYQEGHWDNAIHMYRETEVSSWSNRNSTILSRIKSCSFNSNDAVRGTIHVLDLSASGFIKPHIDAIKFCGYCIAGLSILSPSIMKFCDENNPDRWFKALLPQRSLYIMKNRVRYEFTHEILKTEESYINGKFISKDRRISIICRTESAMDSQQTNDIFQVIPVSLDET